MPAVTGHGADVLAVVEAAYREHFEVLPARASVSFVGVEELEVLRYADGERRHYVSLGMSRYPMADPNDLVIDTGSAPRSELLITTAGQPDDLWRRLAVIAAAPAVEGAVYTAGTRIDLNEPLCAGSRCTGAVLADGPMKAIRVSGMADVKLLSLLPATASELAWARVHGSEALRQRWTEAGTDLSDLAREPVALG